MNSPSRRMQEQSQYSLRSTAQPNGRARRGAHHRQWQTRHRCGIPPTAPEAGGRRQRVIRCTRHGPARSAVRSRLHRPTVGRSCHREVALRADERAESLACSIHHLRLRRRREKRRRQRRRLRAAREADASQMTRPEHRGRTPQSPQQQKPQRRRRQGRAGCRRRDRATAVHHDRPTLRARRRRRRVLLSGLPRSAARHAPTRPRRSPGGTTPSRAMRSRRRRVGTMRDQPSRVLDCQSAQGQRADPMTTRQPRRS